MKFLLNVVIFGFLGLIFFGWLVREQGDGASGTAGNRPTGSSFSFGVGQQADLEVLSWRCDKEHGYAFVRGEVRNLSREKLENAMAVGEFRTSDGTLVKTAEALLNYNPIMPGQTSPFSAATTDNPLIDRCNVSFKYLFGTPINFRTQGG